MLNDNREPSDRDRPFDGKVITTVTVIKSKPEKMASRWRQG